MRNMIEKTTREIKERLFFHENWEELLAEAMEQSYNAGLADGVKLIKPNQPLNVLEL